MDQGRRELGDVAAEMLGGVALGIGASASATLIAIREGWPVLPACVAAALAGMAVGWAAVRIVPGNPRKTLPVFDPVPIMSRDDAYTDMAPAEFDDTLLLDDGPAELPQSSRVVQLFAPGAHPTAGELSARIDHHLGAADAPDASDALHAALEEIRRSLRQR